MGSVLYIIQMVSIAHYFLKPLSLKQLLVLNGSQNGSFKAGKGVRSLPLPVV